MQNGLVDANRVIGEIQSDEVVSEGGHECIRVAIATNLQVDDAACNKGLSVVSASKLVKLVNPVMHDGKSAKHAFKKKLSRSFAQDGLGSSPRLTMVNTERILVPIE